MHSSLGSTLFHLFAATHRTEIAKVDAYLTRHFMTSLPSRCTNHSWGSWGAWVDRDVPGGTGVQRKRRAKRKQPFELDFISSTLQSPRSCTSPHWHRARQPQRSKRVNIRGLTASTSERVNLRGLSTSNLRGLSASTSEHVNLRTRQPQSTSPSVAQSTHLSDALL